jgi:Glycerate kinase family
MPLWPGGPGPSGAAVPRDRPGAGAAGGVGYAAMAVLGGELEPGIGLVLDLIRFADHLPGARLSGSALVVLPRKSVYESGEGLTDISQHGSWRAYRRRTG